MNTNSKDLIATIDFTPELQHQLIDLQKPHIFHYRNAFNQPEKGVLVCTSGRWLAFENRCPHTCTPFVMENGDIKFQIDDENITCLHHFAKFSLQDGFATVDMCAGQKVNLFDVSVVGEKIYISSKNWEWLPSF